MLPVLLDTDVFSFLFKDDSRKTLYASNLANAQPCLSFQSIAELRYWGITRNWGDRRLRNLEDSLKRYILFPYDDAISRHWAELSAHRRRVGRPIECGDAWIAATALRHGLILLTHNPRDYLDIPDLRMISHA